MGTTRQDGGEVRRGPGRPSVVEPDAIIDAAMAMIERDGLEGFSMRSLAKGLGVWPTTLYNHFENKDAVLDEVADRFLGSVPLPSSTDVPWEDWLEDFATAVHATWVAHPRLLAVVMTRPGRGESIAVILDRFLGVLRAAGFPAEEAHSAWHAIQNHLFGEVYQVAEWGTEAAAGPGPVGMADRDPRDFPVLADWGRALEACDRDEQFRIGLHIIIRGLVGGAAGR